MAMSWSALSAGRVVLGINIFFPASDSHFCLRLPKQQGILRLEGLGNLTEVIQ
jgi:hypothetical protein